MSGKGRDPTIEIIKFFSIVLIILLHSVPSKDALSYVSISHISVPIFTSISVWFSVGSGLDAKGNLWRWARSRAWAIYGLFATWNLIYLSIRYFSGGVNIAAMSSLEVAENILISGFANAIWFLPFILIFNVISYTAARAIVAWEERIKMIFALGTFLLGGGILFLPHLTELSSKFHFIEVWPKGIPAVLMTFGLVVINRSIGARFAAHKKVTWPALVALPVFYAALILTSRSILFFEYATAVASFLLLRTLLEKHKIIKFVPSSDMTLLFFVAHPLFLHGNRKVFELFSFFSSTSEVPVQLLIFLLTLVQLTLFWFLLKRIPSLYRVLLWKFICPTKS